MAVPLLFQFFFVGILFKELERSAKETQDEAHARAIISCVDRIFVYAYETSGALYIYAYTQADITHERFEEGIKAIRGELRFLKKNSTAHDQKLFNYLSKEMEAGISALREQKRLITEGLHSGSNEVRLDGYMRVRKLVHTARQLAGVELAAYGKPKRSFEERHNAIMRIMVLGIIGNIILAFGIATFFARNIERRVKVILENVTKFARKEPLLPPLIVTDEIGLVDRAFHDMAKRVLKAEQTKQDFVAMIGHDIRTPATTIKTTLDMLDEESMGKLDSNLRELVTDAGGEARRLMTLTNNLLDLSQLEKGSFHVDPRPHSLNDAVIQSVKSMTLYAQSKKTTIKMRLEEDYYVMADFSRLLQVLINLLSNAVKYSPRNSQINVYATFVDNSFVETVVADNGPGIKEEDRERIFQARERLGSEEDDDERGIGLGLGLAICKSIIEAQGGTIGVSASESGGSAFWFRLPMADGTND